MTDGLQLSSEKATLTTYPGLNGTDGTPKLNPCPGNATSQQKTQKATGN